MCFAEQNTRHLMRDMDARLAPVVQAWNETPHEAVAPPGLVTRLREVLAGWIWKDARA